MLQFARRRRWFLPLTLLLTVVTVQQLMPADGADEGGEHPSVSVREEFSELEEAEPYSDVEAEDQSKSLADVDAVASRTKKRARVHYGKRSAALLPLFLVGLAAAFAAAGFVVKQYKRKGGTAEELKAPVAPEDTDTSSKQGKLSSRPSSKTEVDLSEHGLESLMKMGKRALPPAVALGLVALVVTLIAKKYDVKGWVKRG